MQHAPTHAHGMLLRLQTHPVTHKTPTHPSAAHCCRHARPVSVILSHPQTLATRAVNCVKACMAVKDPVHAWLRKHLSRVVKLVE